jgi:hypothetical protein
LYFGQPAMAASEVGGFPAADAHAKPGGTARKRREQRKRADGRHVAWLISLQQARGSHHTAPARASGAMDDSLAARISSLEEAVASLVMVKKMGHEESGALYGATLVGEGTFEDDGPDPGSDARAEVVDEPMSSSADFAATPAVDKRQADSEVEREQRIELESDLLGLRMGQALLLKDAHDNVIMRDCADKFAADISVIEALLGRANPYDDGGTTVPYGSDIL